MHELHPEDEGGSVAGPRAPALVREAGGYQYLTEKFEVIHTTSVPISDDEALDYFRIVAVWFGEKAVPHYITKRELDGHTYKMMPYTYDAEAGEVNPIEGAES